MDKYQFTRISFVQRLSSTQPISTQQISQVTPFNIQQQNPKDIKQWIPNKQEQLSYPLSVFSDTSESLLNSYSKNSNIKDININKRKCTKILFISFGILLSCVALAALVISICTLAIISKTPTFTTSPTSTTTTTALKVCVNGDVGITFDDLSNLQLVPNGYDNINWTNAKSYTVVSNTSGYYTSVVSKNNTMFNDNGNPVTMQSANSSLITLYSLAVAAAWYDNLQLTVVGYHASAVIINITYILQVYTLSNLVFSGYHGLDTIQFITSGGTQNPSLNLSGPFFGMDNICLSFT